MREQRAEDGRLRHMLAGVRREMLDPFLGGDTA
jgi:hypothetical protein